MKYSSSPCCSQDDPPDGPTSGPDDENRVYSGERKCRRNGDTPIVSGPHDNDGDKGKGDSGSNGGNKGGNNGKRHCYS